MNKNSKVLALKYRPQTFDDLIGQDVVAETIINSIKANKTPNAYLFTGIRGVGKTTIARIVAKSLNCSNGIEKLCKEKLCENCKSITDSSHIDVLELNGADKTSINDIRDLIELSRYRPTSSKFKIFIIDEVHQISSAAFNALLKILEEPPEYLKFIFATTEIKKVPVTILSRCQRFDLSRIKSLELLEFIKKIKEKENGKASDDALKLIVKISEGSVRDALSLLDRALLALDDGEELKLNTAQKIFGRFDKSQLIDMFSLIFQGEEKKVIESYKKIYDQGIEPKVFLNDFLELLYYFKNISSLTLESTNFSLNDEEFTKIKEISHKIDNSVLLLFWQFTIKTLDELDIVTNQHLSIEMFLLRLMYLTDLKFDVDDEKNISTDHQEVGNINRKKKNPDDVSMNTQPISQIKNISQDKDIKPKSQKESKIFSTDIINSFDNLLEICVKKKEMKLKYELENNVNLVNFENQRIEISFNDKLDKNFLKDLSLKLFEWTNARWIITLSKSKGDMTYKDKEKNKKLKLFDETKKTKTYEDVLRTFPDAKLEDIDTEN